MAGPTSAAEIAAGLKPAAWAATPTEAAATAVARRHNRPGAAVRAVTEWHNQLVAAATPLAPCHSVLAVEQKRAAAVNRSTCAAFAAASGIRLRGQVAQARAPGPAAAVAAAQAPVLAQIVAPAVAIAIEAMAHVARAVPPQVRHLR